MLKLFLVAVLSFVQGVEPPGGVGSVAGTVREGGTGFPIRSVEIAVQCGTQGKSANSDDQGRYRIEALPAGRCTVRLRHGAW